MKKEQTAATIYKYFLILILLVAIAYRGGRDYLFYKNEVEINVSLNHVKEIFPNAEYFEKNRNGVYDVYDKNTNKIGSALLSTNYSKEFGYGGIVPLLIGVDDSLTITKVTLLPNNETGEYIEAIYGNNFIGKWNGIKLENAMDLQVDVISGATHTSNAVIAGVKKTAASIMKTDVSIINENKVWTRIKDILFLTVMVLSLLMAFKKGTAKFHTIYMLLVLVIMGIILNKALSVQLMSGWLYDGFSWRTNWQSSIIFILAIAVSFIGKRKFYCNYLCPMGALQDLSNRFTPFKKRNLPTRFKGITVREIYLTLIAGALLLGFTPQLSHLEPFMFFSFRIIGMFFIIFGLAVFILSLFFYKPWCSVCPTGCLLDTISHKKTKNIQSK